MKGFLLNRQILIAFLFCSCFSFLISSCAGRINGSLSVDGSASMSVTMSMEPRMTALIRSLSAAGGKTDSPVVDGPAIALSMSAAPGVASAQLRNTTPPEAATSAIEGTVRISNVNEFLAASNTVTSGGQRSQRGFVFFEQTAAGGRCEIFISRENGPVILELLSPEITDYLHALMAPLVTGEDLDKIEYLDLVASFYNRAVSAEIAGSRILASIEFPGAISAVTGGTFSGRRAEFDIPLLDLLVVETPVRLEVRWR